jgi:hypothetical protein
MPQARLAYDAAGRTYHDQLTGVTHTNGAFANESFSFDAVGNRTMSGYATQAGNRLTTDGTYT